MGNSYSDKLRDPRWQKKRLEILERDEWMCWNCGDTENTLVVHHKWYAKGCEPWDYEDDAFITLCDDCHAEEKEVRARNESDLLHMTRRYLSTANITEVIIAIKNLVDNLPESLALDQAFTGALWVFEKPELMEEMYRRFIDRNKARVQV